MTQAKIRVAPELAGLSRSAWEQLIYESNLGIEDTDIATRYFINKECQIDIAIDKNIERHCVSRRLKIAQARILATYLAELPS